MMFIFLENALNLGILANASPLRSKLSPRFLSSHSRHMEITHSSRQHLFGNPFPPTAERCGGNYDWFYQNSVRKYEDDLEH